MVNKKRLLILFLLVVALPGIALTALGVKTLHQEKMNVEQEIHDWLQSSHARIEAEANREFDKWSGYLLNLPEWSQIESESLLDKGSTGNQGRILAQLSGSRIETIPEDGLLYSLNTPSKEDGEREELRSLYNKGRRLRESGRFSEATNIYEKLRTYSNEQLGNVPVDMIAEYEICTLYREMKNVEALGRCASSFYESLVGGKWLVEKPRYLFYSARAKEWLDSVGRIHEMNGLVALEDRRMRMTELVDSLASQTESVLQDRKNALKAYQTDEGTGFAFLYRPARGGPVIAMILTPSTAMHVLWPSIFSENILADFVVELKDSGGVVLYTSDRPADPDQFCEKRYIQVAGNAWALSVWPRDAQQFYSELQRKQIIYISIFILFTASLGFAVYISVRALYQDLEIARLKEDFVSAVSHEFRTPLTGIRQVAEMLAAGRVAGDEKRSLYYSMILRESEQMSRMVENLLAYARGSGKGPPFKMERIDTSRWLNETVSQFQRSVAGSSATIKLSISGALPVINGDSVALSLALANLMDNAVKYSPQGAQVEIEAEGNDAWVTIRVRDTGIGISEEDQRRIFERFHRGSDTYVSQKRGTGLGLSLVHDIVAAHKGKVRVESTPGAGSVFTVALPSAPFVDSGKVP